MYGRAKERKQINHFFPFSFPPVKKRKMYIFHRRKFDNAVTYFYITVLWWLKGNFLASKFKGKWVKGASIQKLPCYLSFVLFNTDGYTKTSPQIANSISHWFAFGCSCLMLFLTHSSVSKYFYKYQCMEKI